MLSNMCVTLKEANSALIVKITKKQDLQTNHYLISGS